MSLIDCLRSNKLVTEEQLDEARYRREQWGGRLEDHLFLLRAIGERDLLRTLAEVHSWKTVAISQRTLSAMLVSIIPAKMAWELRVLPFSHDPKTNLTLIACRDPHDQTLKSRLAQLMHERPFELYAAVGPLLDGLIIDQYRISNLIDSPPKQDSAVGDPKAPNLQRDSIEKAKTAIIFSTRWETDKHIAMALSQEDYLVVVCESLEETLEELENRYPQLLLIHDIQPNSRRQIQQQVARLAPDCVIRFYHSAADLILPAPIINEQDLLLKASLQVATAAMATMAGKSAEEARQTKPYVERLCKLLHLEPHDELVTICTAFMHDTASLYFNNETHYRQETLLFKMLALAGDNLVYPPSALAVIRYMYADLSQMTAEETESANVRNGNIVTAVDFYLRHLESQERLSAHRYDIIQHNLRAQVGTLFLPEVIEAFLTLLQQEIVCPQTDGSLKQALILDELGITQSTLTEQMRSCGFECAVADSVDRFMQCFRESKPDFIVLAVRGNADKVQQFVEELVARGISFPDTPAFVICKARDEGHIAPLLKLGLLDVIRFEGNFDILLIRMHHVLAEQEKKSRERLKVLQDSGTHGNLEHMSVIDLLQALGPSAKTTRISVTGHGKQLTMFIDHGKLIYAERDGITGAKAIFETLGWKHGIWSVDQIEQSELPEPNNSRAIDSILIEGVHYIDELERGGAQARTETEKSKDEQATTPINLAGI